jgi:predicted DNA-binding transcriptional regulator YafY
MAEAAVVLSREFGVSRRQAYRYLEEAQAIGRPAAGGEAAVPITLKIPGNVVRDLRAYSAASGLTLGEIVARAVAAFLAAAREHG